MTQFFLEKKINNKNQITKPTVVIIGRMID